MSDLLGGEQETAQFVAKQKEITEALFKRWWKEYPNKQQKKSAWDKWCKLDHDTMQVIISHTQDRAKTDPKWIKGFVPMPVTFLNQQRWQDEWEPEQGKKKSTGKPAIEQTICKRCRGDTRSQRHVDICADNMPYWDFKKSNGEHYTLDRESGWRLV